MGSHNYQLKSRLDCQKKPMIGPIFQFSQIGRFGHWEKSFIISGHFDLQTWPKPYCYKTQGPTPIMPMIFWAMPSWMGISRPNNEPAPTSNSKCVQPIGPTLFIYKEEKPRKCPSPYDERWMHINIPLSICVIYL